MDYLAKRWSAYTRDFPFVCELQAVGYLPNKDLWVRRSHEGLNFSFILRGGGDYLMDGKRWLVEAPCMILQFPKVYCEYGPTGPHEAWEEVYLSYLTESLPQWEEMQMVDRNRPVWPIHSKEWIESRFAEINESLERRADQNCADWLDREVHRLIFDVLQLQSPSKRKPEEVAVYAAYEWLERNYHQKVDWDWLAKEQGMSPRSFRRYWVSSFKKPPAAFLNEMRMTIAQHQLVETEQSVQDIAARVGFDDPLYFSRLFRKHHGVSPSEYRRAFEMRFVQ